MPELPEVEVLVRNLRPLLRGKTIRSVEVGRAKVLGATSERKFSQVLRGAKFGDVTRRGKYLLFELRIPGRKNSPKLVGHLGMTGRMYLLSANAPLPKHAAVVLSLGREKFVFEDTRYFGRLTLDDASVAKLGPEPLSEEFTAEEFGKALSRSAQAIKVKLLDQSLVAGVGNIYASEALFLAWISPTLPARKLKREQIEKLRRAVRKVLTEAIQFGSTVALSYDGAKSRDKLFYYGVAAESSDYYEERLRVYDRAGKPCIRCKTPIKRIVQAARSTFYCPHCQSAGKPSK